jgi:CRISPR type III-A-associated RAMP protein Csm4
MPYKALKLSFTSPLHLSDVRANDYGKSQRMLHSDALTAAIMQTWAMLGKTEWIEKDSGFVTSSLFPFTKAADTPVYFLPKPFCGLNIPKDKTDPALAKKAKKVQYFDTRYFQLALNQTAIEGVLEKNFQGAYLSDNEIDSGFLTSDTRIRIRKPRNDAEDAEPFYMEQLRFKEDSGLWGIFWFENENIQKRVEIAIEYLQESGLGTDRNVGNGQFTCEWTGELPLEITTPTTYGLNLSLFCPNDQPQLTEMLDAKARYELIKRGGWLSEPYGSLRKRSVYMFKEGSVFKMPTATNLLGEVIDLQPEIIKNQHPVWRSGKALFIPIAL